MRAFELKKSTISYNLRESKLIRIEDPGSYRDDYVVYKNPGPREIKQLLDRHNELRGSVDFYDKNIFVWEAYKATHSDAKHELNIRHWDFDFVLSTTDEIDEGDWGTLSRIGNYFYGDDKNNRIKNKFLDRIFNYLEKDAQGQ